MSDFRNKHAAERERILAEGVREVVAELRLVEAVDYVAFLRMDRLGNIADIVNSSAQLYMKAGTLRFAGDGDVSLTWNAPPIVDLGMEFRNRGASAHFRLRLAASSAAVTLTYLAFADPDVPPDAQTERLAAAVADARLDWRRPAGGARN